MAIYARLALLLTLTTLAACGGHAHYANRALPPGALPISGAGDFDQPPVLVKGRSPVYPVEHMLRHESGTAELRFTIGVDGRTHDIQVLSASEPIFGIHAVSAVQQWLYQPARRHGQPVAVSVRTPISFERR